MLKKGKECLYFVLNKENLNDDFYKKNKNVFTLNKFILNENEKKVRVKEIWENLPKENLLILENRFQDSKLENNYLSSSEKLIEFQKLYFENSLKKKNLKDLKLLKIIDGEIVIQQLEFLKKNGE